MGGVLDFTRLHLVLLGYAWLCICIALPDFPGLCWALFGLEWLCLTLHSFVYLSDYGGRLLIPATGTT